MKETLDHPRQRAGATQPADSICGNAKSARCRSKRDCESDGDEGRLVSSIFLLPFFSTPFRPTKQRKQNCIRGEKGPAPLPESTARVATAATACARTIAATSAPYGFLIGQQPDFASRPENSGDATSKTENAFFITYTY